jgi:hypothetical protein
MKTTIPTITITTTTPEHSENGYWNYEMEIAIGDDTHSINCWKFATWLEAGASADIDGSGLRNWGNSQPGGWRVLNGDSQTTGIPRGWLSDDKSAVELKAEGDSLTIQVPEGCDPDEFLEALEAAIEEAATEADPDEPDADDVWAEMPSYRTMDNYPVAIGKVFGSREVIVAWENPDGSHGFELAPDPDDPCDELKDLVLSEFAAEYASKINRATED